MNFIFSFITVAWIIRHIWLLLGILAALTLIIVLLLIHHKKRRRSYLALPVLLIGNKATKVYHDLYCAMLSGANRANLVGFRLEKEVARSGYAPCSVCHPRWPQ